MLVNQNIKLLKTKGQKQDGYQTLTGRSSEYPVGLRRLVSLLQSQKPLSYHITERICKASLCWLPPYAKESPGSTVLPSQAQRTETETLE